MAELTLRESVVMKVLRLCEAESTAACISVYFSVLHVRHDEPSPPHTPHRSTFLHDPTTPSQPRQLFSEAPQALHESIVIEALIGLSEREAVTASVTMHVAVHEPVALVDTCAISAVVSLTR